MCRRSLRRRPGASVNTPQGDAENYVSVRNSAGSPGTVSDLSAPRE
jgi:hypothetical protein